MKLLNELPVIGRTTQPDYTLAALKRILPAMPVAEAAEKLEMREMPAELSEGLNERLLDLLEPNPFDQPLPERFNPSEEGER